ncbi:hypothetical protein IWW51_002654 [Coemansia sp. RSA 2702]|nr:hypothetical protein IWW51_002654 [Coemansia sp. RSA 2702]
MARPEQGKLALGFEGAFSQPGEAKTAVGRSSVLYDYQRRHSADMYERGTKRGADSDESGSASPPRGVATADKPYACDQCELTFSRQHNLKSHALTHSTERPFSCAVCHTPFRRQHDLKRHMKLHTGEKPYTCSNCGRSFARLDALNRHMRAENFHACSQAAKKQRTQDPRLEQRRASHNPGGSGGWAHWTHRPSIAADEAMLRRMHERYGRPPPMVQAATAPYGFAPQPPPPQPYALPHPPPPASMPQAPMPQASMPPGAMSQAPVSQGAGPARAAKAGAAHAGDPRYIARAEPLPPPRVERPWNGQLPPVAAPPSRALPPPHIRLPPIELVPPRRHSLAVTSHLERYRAHDATPPPPQSQPPPAGSQPDAKLLPARTPPQPSTPVSYARAQMEPVPEEQAAELAATAASQQAGEYHRAAKCVDYPPKPVVDYPAAKPAEAPRPIGYLSPLHAASSSSRRNSLTHASPLHADAPRRSSIIALTTPQEDELRHENVELRRRLGELEAKYSRELERLNASVHELEIEKTLLKNMLLEKGGVPPPSPLSGRSHSGFGMSPAKLGSQMPRSAP